MIFVRVFSGESLINAINPHEVAYVAVQGENLLLSMTNKVDLFIPAKVGLSNVLEKLNSALNMNAGYCDIRF